MLPEQWVGDECVENGEVWSCQDEKRVEKEQDRKKREEVLTTVAVLHCF